MIVRESVAGNWVSVAENRQQRPLSAEGGFCPFCPGPAGEVGEEPFYAAVFPNRFPPFSDPGAAEVLVYSPRHTDDLAYLDPAHAGAVAAAWGARTEALSARDDVAQVFVFENRGPRVGASVAHAHGQIYGFPLRAPRLARELEVFHEECPLCADRDAGRVLLEVPGFRVMAPPAPRMPYELWIVPDRHGPSIAEAATLLESSGVHLVQAALRALDCRFEHRTELTWGIYQDTGREPSPYHWRIDILPYERGGGRFKHLAGSELQMDAFLLDVSPATTVADLGPLLRAEWGGR